LNSFHRERKGVSGTSPKEKVALSSILAAILLTSTKFVVGVLTNSLGIISEALHSGLDLIAAATTYFAVRKADKPPDKDHHYGHGKVESIASLSETFLLIVTGLWVVYEAINRLLFKEVVVQVGVVALLVMLMSIGVDFSRSRVLYKYAKKYNSQALEADAIHFSTDLISSAVVVVGIVPTILGFKYFDSMAALGVAVVIFAISFRIGRRSIDSLMDKAPMEIIKRVTEGIQRVEGVEKIGQVRVRGSGARTFIDITVFIDKVLPLEVAHGVTDRLSKRIQSIVPNSDVIVHAEPLSVETAALVAKIRSEAVNFPEIKNIHNIWVSEVDKKLHVDFHIELEGDLSLTKAHDLSSELEARIRKLDSSIVAVSSHVEPVDGGTYNGAVDQVASNRLRAAIAEIIKSFPEVRSFHEIDIERINEKFKVNIHCLFKSDITVNDAHRIATQIEETIKSKVKEIEVVSIHLEPEF